MPSPCFFELERGRNKRLLSDGEIPFPVSAIVMVRDDFADEMVIDIEGCEVSAHASIAFLMSIMSA